MAGPWEKYGSPQGTSAGPWAKYAAMPQEDRASRSGFTPGPIEGATILPFSKDALGKVSFDTNAGLLGDIKRAFMMPGDVVSGKIDPESPGAIQSMTNVSLLAGPVSAAARAGEKAVTGVSKALRPAKPAVPTADALKEASEAGFEAARTMGVDYSSAAVKSLADDTAQELESKGILAELTPKTFSILRKLQEPPADSVAGIEGLVAARRALNNAAGDFTNPTERLAANRVIDRLDEFLKGSDAESVVAGPAPAAAKILEDSRGDYAAAKRSDRITGAEDRAELNAGVANSGNNLDNQLRQRLADILKRPKESRGYSEEELALIRKAAVGGLGANAARKVGNLLGGGGGLGRELTAALGMAVGGSIGGFAGAGVGAAALPLAGALSRRAATKLTQRQINLLDELIRKRSPLYQQALRNPPMTPTNPDLRFGPMRSLLLAAPGLMQGQQ